MAALPLPGPWELPAGPVSSAFQGRGRRWSAQDYQSRQQWLAVMPGMDLAASGLAGRCSVHQLEGALWSTQGGLSWLCQGGLPISACHLSALPSCKAQRAL